MTVDRVLNLYNITAFVLYCPWNDIPAIRSHRSIHRLYHRSWIVNHYGLYRVFSAESSLWWIIWLVTGNQFNLIFPIRQTQGIPCIRTFFLRVLIDNLPCLFIFTLKIYCQLKGVIVWVFYLPLDIFLRYLVMWFLARGCLRFCFRLAVCLSFGWFLWCRRRFFFYGKINYFRRLVFRQIR